MDGLEKDTIGGFNSLLDKQKKVEGDAYVSTVLFDTKFELIHDRERLHEVNPMTEEEYYTRGCTALLDAIGNTIVHIKNIHKYAASKNVPKKTIVVIITDGMENSSRLYSYNKVHNLIAEQKEEYGWEFIFLGANMDAIASAGLIGIDAGNSANYHCDSEGTELNYEVLSDTIADFRDKGCVNEEWKERIDFDFKNRR